MPEGPQITLNDLQDPQRLFRLLRAILDQIYSTGNRVQSAETEMRNSMLTFQEVWGQGMQQMRTLLDGVSQPAEARLILGLGAMATVRHNFDATTLTNPTANNDFTQGYGIGSIWVNQTPGATNQAFMQVLSGFPTAGGAVWKQITV